MVRHCQCYTILGMLNKAALIPFTRAFHYVKAGEALYTFDAS